MSFSSETKAELCRLPLQKRCCALAEAYGVLMYCNTFSATEIRIITSNPEFRDRLPRLFKKAFGCEFDPLPPGDIKGKYVLAITKPSVIEHIFASFGSDPKYTLAHHINLGVLEDSCCKASFLRGAFLAGGSLTDPAKSYHLELATAHYNVSRETFSVLLELSFSPKDADSFVSAYGFALQGPLQVPKNAVPADLPPLTEYELNFKAYGELMGDRRCRR